MPTVAEMLIEADRTAKSDADLRVKIALVLEYARAEVKQKPEARQIDLLGELVFAAREFHRATQRRLNTQYALTADDTAVRLLGVHIDAYRSAERRLIEVLDASK